MGKISELYKSCHLDRAMIAGVFLLPVFVLDTWDNVVSSNQKEKSLF